MENPGSLLRQAALLSSTEWRVLVSIHRLGKPVALPELACAVPEIPTQALAALLDRLASRGLLHHDQDQAWGPLIPSFESLFLAQIEHFFDTYVQDDPAGLRLVQEVLDSRWACLKA